MSEISNISTDEKLLPSQNDSATNHAETAVSSELTELSTDEWRDCAKRSDLRSIVYF